MWINLKKRIWKRRNVLVNALIVGPMTTGILLGLRFMGIFQPLELATYDLFFQWRSPEPIDDRIVIVAINESDIQKFGLPITDKTLVKLLNLINQQEPRVIGLDIYRDLPVPKEASTEYAQLVDIFTSTPNLIGIRNVIGVQNGDGVSAPPILEKLNRVAANDLPLDSDSKVRRVLLSLKDKQNKTVPSLSAALAVQYLKKENINLEVLDSQKQEYKLGKAIFLPLQANAGGYVREQVGGYQILSNFRNFQDGFQTVSLTNVLQGRIPDQIFRDRLVIIGVTAESSQDYFITPQNSAIFGRSLPVTSGVNLHADITSQIIANALDGRPVLQTWSKPIESLWILLWAIASGWLYRKRHYAKPNTKPNTKLNINSKLNSKLNTNFNTKFNTKLNFTLRLPWANLLILSLGIGIFTTSYFAFVAGWWIPVVPALIALFGNAIAVSSYNALSANESRRRAILSVIPDLMFNVSGDGTYLGYVNYENPLELLNPDIEHIGQHISQFLPPEVSDRHLLHIQRALESGEIQMYEQRVWREDKWQDEEVRIVVSGVNEVVFMVRNISDRKQAEAAIYKKNVELATTLDALKNTQKQLVESEKYAALGSMVAGVAHEVNTPVGNSLMAASILENATQKFRESFERGELKKSSLQTYLDKAKTSSEILLANLERAAELIQNFKQVAVDQSNLEQRHFQVKEYIEKILISLDPQLKYTPHQVTVRGDEAIAIQTYPGAFSQIVTNLVMNSLTHAYHGSDQSGKLDFEITEQEGKVLIIYSDDGKGIPSDSLSRIFEPFFTTARDRGGSGLGLHIIYNLVTQNLKGTIVCESEVGVGTKFIIVLPLNL